MSWICRALLPAGLTAVSSPGCVFVAPPPLADELDAQRTRQDARIAELRSGKAVPPEDGDGSGDPAAEGEEAVARPGMSPAEIRQYAIEQGDPEEGDFTLEEATAGLAGTGELWVRLETGRGGIECRLLEDVAPQTVANFVGLARGVRPFKDAGSGEWKTGPYYDGTIFHRVIPGFMVQAGDPLGTGLGNAGYVIGEETDPGVLHEGPGLLSMANRGPGTGSSQFFLTLGPTPHLDGKHTIFGRCTEEGIAVADDISLTPRDAEDRPKEDEVLERVVVFRRSPAAAGEPPEEPVKPEKPGPGKPDGTG